LSTTVAELRFGVSLCEQLFVTFPLGG